MKKEEIIVYGDGSVIRDFIYIDDVINAIVNIADGEKKNHTYNVGCGYGTSINRVLEIIESVLEINLIVKHKQKREVDVPENYLDISRYEKDYGKLSKVSLEEGIIKTARFMKDNYII